MSRGLGVAVLCAGVVAVGAASAWLRTAPAAPPPPPPRPYVLPVTLATVERRDVVPRVALAGTARAASEASLAFERAGVVAVVSVREADVVEAGQVLARLSAEEEVLQVSAAAATLARAERELGRVEAGPREEERRRLAAELEAARAEVALAALEVERARALQERDVESQAGVDRRVAALRVAEARAAAAAEQHAEAVAGARAEDVEVARARVAEARAALALAESDLARTVLRAPWRGAVVRRRLSAGAHVVPGEPVLDLVDPDHVDVEVPVPGRVAVRLAAGAGAVLRLDELPGREVATSIAAVVPAADPLSRNFVAIVRLEPTSDPERLVKPGMFVRVDVALAALPGALVVPADAVRVTGQGPIVVRAVEAPPAPSGGPGPSGTPGAPGPGPPAPPPAGPGPPQAPALVAAWVPVRVLGGDANGTAIESLGPPLQDGDRVVATGLDLAFPGCPLLPRDAAPPPPTGGTP